MLQNRTRYSSHISSAYYLQINQTHPRLLFNVKEEKPAHVFLNKKKNSLLINDF